MSALAAARVVLVARGTLKKATFPLKAGSKAFEGGMACYDTASAGSVTQGAVSTTLVPIGLWIDTKDNSAGGSTVPIGVDLNREHFIEYWDSVTGGGAVTISNLFADVYIADDHTVTTVSSGASKYGKVWAVSPQGYPGAVGVEAVYSG